MLEEECYICKTTFNLNNSHDIPQYIGGKDCGTRLLCKKHHREYDIEDVFDNICHSCLNLNK